MPKRSSARPARAKAGPTPPRKRAVPRLEPQAFRLFAESLVDYSIVMLDPRGVVLTWNPGAERTFGYTPSEIIGGGLAALYPAAEREAGQPERDLAEVNRAGRLEREGWRVRQDGRQVWVSSVLTGLYGPRHKLLGFTLITRDLTERKRAEDALRLSEERFRLLVASVKDYAIFMLDPEGRVRTWNQGAERFKGYRAEEIIGSHIERFYTREDAAAGRPQQLLQVATEEGRVEDEGWRVRKDGTRFWADVVITALRDPGGKLLGFTKVTRDLTERKSAEEERLARVHAEEAVRLRDEFLSIASHELKTPLTSLQLLIQSITIKKEAQDPRLISKLERVERSAARLNELVESLLDVSRIATGKFNLSPEPLDLSALARDLVERMQEGARAAGCELELELEPGVEGVWDRLRLEQVLTNLLSNAFKYAAGRPVVVSVSRTGQGWARLEVSDHGPGIPEEALGRIFGRFERAASLRHYAGLGLGLYVTRQIVMAHGGRVSAVNRPDGGARFVVELPPAPPPHAQPEAH